METLNNDLRIKVKSLKKELNITYKSLSTDMGIHQTSFRNWLNGQYNFSYERLMDLRSILQNIK